MISHAKKTQSNQVTHFFDEKTIVTPCIISMAPCILRNTLHISVPYILRINNIYTLLGFGSTDFELHAFECKSMTFFQI